MLTVLNMRTFVVAAIIMAIFALFGAQAFAKTSGETRPGWGLGDDSHDHVGPPGTSVFPGPPGQSVRP